MYRRRTLSLPTLINSKPQAPLANWSIAYFTTSGEKCIVWEGAGDQSPTLSELSAIPTDLQPTQLIVIAIEVLKNAPLESLGVLLQILSSFYCRNADNKIDVEILVSVTYPKLSVSFEILTADIASGIKRVENSSLRLHFQERRYRLDLPSMRKGRNVCPMRPMLQKI